MLMLDQYLLSLHDSVKKKSWWKAIERQKKSVLVICQFTVPISVKMKRDTSKVQGEF